MASSRQAFTPGNAEMAEGTIKKLTDKGFGFIKTSGDKDLFFHSSSVQGGSFDDLREGQRSRTRKARAKKDRVPRTSSRCSFVDWREPR